MISNDNLQSLHKGKLQIFIKPKNIKKYSEKKTKTLRIGIGNREKIDPNKKLMKRENTLIMLNKFLIKSIQM